MPRQPKYRRHSVRDLGFVEHGGKRVYFNGPYDSDRSRGEYITFLRSIGFLVYNRGEKPDCQLTLMMLVERFTDWADATFPGRRSRAGNLRSFTALLLKFLGDDLAVNFTPLRLKEFQRWMVGRKVTRRYINDTTSAIRQMFKWGVSEELLPLATYQALMTVPGLKRNHTAAKELPPRRPVEWKHVAKTLKKLNPTVRAMVNFHWLTGVRSQSICSARVGQFDCTKQPWEWKPRHKTEHIGHDLTVFVGPQAQKVLAPWLKNKEPSDYVFQPKGKTGKRSRLYRSHYDADSYRQAVKRAAKLAKVPHWSPHRLRHTRGTLVRDKYGLEAAQASLGHRRIDATQIYAQAQRDKARKVAKEMG